MGFLRRWCETKCDLAWARISYRGDGGIPVAPGSATEASPLHVSVNGRQGAPWPKIGIGDGWVDENGRPVTVTGCQ